MGFTRARTDSSGVRRFQATYRDVKGQQRALGTFATKAQADRAWQRAEEDQAEGRRRVDRRGSQRLGGYVVDEWLPNHQMEARTRETYTYYIERHILPAFSGMKLVAVMPIDVRRWVVDLKTNGVSPAVIRQCHTILSAIFTTALNDQLIQMHPCRGVKVPPVPRKVRTIITPEEFEEIHSALPNDAVRLFVELDIETGLRWGELIELRSHDFDTRRGTLLISRVAVEITVRFSPTGERYFVKEYPKDREHRRLKLGPAIARALQAHIAGHRLASDDLLFTVDMLAPRQASPPTVSTPTGLTEPNAYGRQYAHGTLSGYSAGCCRCEHCRAACARYRSERRAAGLERSERRRRTLDTDGHIPRNWFRNSVWQPAVSAAGITIKVRTHDLRHAHASWLLAGGADLQYVRERMGHSSVITTEKYLHTLDGKDDTVLEAFAIVRRRGDRPGS